MGCRWLVGGADQAFIMKMRHPDRLAVGLVEYPVLLKEVAHPCGLDSPSWVGGDVDLLVFVHPFESRLSRFAQLV
ncbi:hypothetical protein D3C85_1630010 [compost metagenome]